MKKIVEESIEIYNSMRPHLSCNMLTPDVMHLQSKKIKPSYKKVTHTSTFNVACAG